MAIDAQRGEVYSGRFDISIVGNAAHDRFERDGEIEIVTTDYWLATLDADVLATGPALVKLADKMPSSARIAPRGRWLPTAASIGRLAARRAASGEQDDLWALAPRYLRRSAAEEKWENRAT